MVHCYWKTVGLCKYLYGIKLYSVRSMGFCPTTGTYVVLEYRVEKFSEVGRCLGHCYWLPRRTMSAQLFQQIMSKINRGGAARGAHWAIDRHVRFKRAGRRCGYVYGGQVLQYDVLLIATDTSTSTPYVLRSVALELK
jgi:hypothetical protein